MLNSCNFHIFFTVVLLVSSIFIDRTKCNITQKRREKLVLQLSNNLLMRVKRWLIDNMFLRKTCNDCRVYVSYKSQVSSDIVSLVEQRIFMCWIKVYIHVIILVEILWCVLCDVPHGLAETKKLNHQRPSRLPGGESRHVTKTHLVTEDDSNLHRLS